MGEQRGMNTARAASALWHAALSACSLHPPAVKCNLACSWRKIPREFVSVESVGLAAVGAVVAAAVWAVGDAIRVSDVEIKKSQLGPTALCVGTFYRVVPEEMPPGRTLYGSPGLATSNTSTD